MENESEGLDQTLRNDELAGAMMAYDMVSRLCKSLTDPSYQRAVALAYQSLMEDSRSLKGKISEREFFLMSTMSTVIAHQLINRFKELFQMLGIGQQGDHGN